MNAAIADLHVDLVQRYQTRLGLSWTPSLYQARLFDWVVEGRGHRVVKAVAGAGKTTSIVAAAKLITGRGLFVAFNVEIADMLRGKLAGTRMKSRTVNAHGMECVVRSLGHAVDVDAKKYRKMVEEAAEKVALDGVLRGYPLTQKQIAEVDKNGFPVSACAKLIDLARLALIEMNGNSFERELLDLADRHGLDDHAACLDDLVVIVVQHCMRIGRERMHTIDFIDQLWLPNVNRWQPQQFSWVIVDECQDISPAALELLSKSRRNGGRMLFVGDPNQSINAFAGADSESFDKIVARTQAEPLPLSVCYRCPTRVLDLARAYCPEIEARPGAPEGVVRTAKRSEYVAEAREGDLVLCRRNAPLLSMCFELIAEGVPAQVKGKDIATKLVSIVKKAARGRSFSDFGVALEDWNAAQVEIARMRITDKDRLAERIELIADQEECVRVVWASSGATSASGLCEEIGKLFAEGRGSVTLSSIHKAKGLEAKRVAILEPERLTAANDDGSGSEGKRPLQPWQLEQEKHVAYVGITRAEEELIWLESEAAAKAA
jgi:hypothetical protein